MLGGLAIMPAENEREENGEEGSVQLSASLRMLTSD